MFKILIDCISKDKDSVVTRDSDGYVNSTILIRKIGKNKKIAEWYRLKKTKLFITALSKHLNLDEKCMVKIENYVSNDKKGTWTHPVIAVNIAQWCDNNSSIEMFDNITSLVTLKNTETGEYMSVEKDKIIDDWKNKWNEAISKINNLEIENKVMKNKIVSFKEKHNYYKLKSGLCYYILSDKREDQLFIKHGISGTGKTTDINSRLKNYRTHHPNLTLEYLVYLNKPENIENFIKESYNEYLNSKNHEWFVFSDYSFLEKFKTSVDTILTVYKNFNKEDEQNIILYNEDVKLMCDKVEINCL